MKFTKLSLIILLTATTAVQAGLLSKILYWGLSIGVPVLKNVDDSRKGWRCGVRKKPIFDTKCKKFNWNQISKKNLFGLNKYDHTKLAIGTAVPCGIALATREVFRKSLTINPYGRILLGLVNCSTSLGLSQWYDKVPGWYNNAIKSFHKSLQKFANS